MSSYEAHSYVHLLEVCKIHEKKTILEEFSLEKFLNESGRILGSIPREISGLIFGGIPVEIVIIKWHGILREEIFGRLFKKKNLGGIIVEILVKISGEIPERILRICLNKLDL